LHNHIIWFRLEEKLILVFSKSMRIFIEGEGDEGLRVPLTEEERSSLLRKENAYAVCDGMGKESSYRLLCDEVETLALQEARRQEIEADLLEAARLFDSEYPYFTGEESPSA
jgi:hypothetical protein